MVLEQSIVIPIALGTGTAGTRLQWAFHPGVTLIGTTRLRLYPAIGAVTGTNRGSLVRETTVSFDVDREVITFTGSNSASTEFPIVGGLTVNVLGFMFDKEGDSASPSFELVNGSLRADEEVVGVVEVSYTTTYDRYLYTLDVIGDTIFGGYVFAFHEGIIATQAVDPAALDTGDELSELYTIFSQAVINEVGVFEKPPDWTGASDSPTHSGGDPIPGDASVLVERPHEIGYMTPDNNFRVRSYFVPKAEPFKFTSSYKIPTGIRVATPGQGAITLEQLNHPAAQSALTAAQAKTTGLV